MSYKDELNENWNYSKLENDAKDIEESKEIRKELFESRVLWNENIKEEKPCIEIVDRFNNKFPLATFGNISVITGQAKSRKSFFVGAIASSFCNVNFETLECIKTTRNEDKRMILYFDTEQARFHVKSVLNRIIDMSGKDPEELEFLSVFCLRKYAPNERLEIIENAIEVTKNLGLVIIDGIRDLITNINDPDQATMITTKLMKWSEEKDCHILTVIHENKGNEQARGHIGTELINKAETVISIRKEQENSLRSEVIPTYTRGKSFTNFAFTINEEGYPIIDKAFKPDNKGRKQKFNMTELKTQEIEVILKSAFKQSKELTYLELLESLQFACLDQLNTHIGTNKAKEFLTYLKGKELIIKIDPDNHKSKFKSAIK
jgi:RecA-family ATPase